MNLVQRGKAHYPYSSEDSALGPLGEPGPAREDFGGLALQNLRKAVGEDLLAHGPKGAG
ncbi:hypothetical protein PF005_g31161 [Phytophthora fragariae]|uniref:Uncharacterized protein n=1 Tax=Phytophthora fragariae TaxID=53985 RepID=A0A6A3PUZ2_9STRA|nr:hypothetical protein PF003_g24319 [Phytophthora fragariae]KAE8926037.1 hypothetical protein PF009_g23769 [Phytophthora fragariae]KAE8959510.1 hypothetical protein PF011_g30405 [Phytophthora fragariae]KAE9058563.1 hypothetical protein PF010_g30954 [Phytophthora fragariae]KAE9063314.1 hypothetical protein PF006_g30977 [Phytophthora fragariae]